MKRIVILLMFFVTACFASTANYDTLRLGDGSASSPAMQFNSDPNTGIYRKAADQIGIVVGGVEAVDIENNKVSVFNLDVDNDLFITGLMTLSDFTNATHDHSNAAGGGQVDHGTLTGLGDDDHSQYALLLGRAGSQTISGGTAASENLILDSTTNATKGFVKIGSNVWIDSGLNAIGVGTSSPTDEIQVVGEAARVNVNTTGGLDGGFEIMNAGNRVWQLIVDVTDDSFVLSDNTSVPLLDLSASGQLGIGSSADTHSTPAIFEVTSTLSASIANPKMTEINRDAIGSLVSGLTIYNTTSNELNLYDGTSWGAIGGGGGGGATTELDNLTTTSINADLIPSTTDSRSFGSSTRVWNRLHTHSILFKRTAATVYGFIDSDSSIAQPSGNTVTVSLLNGITTATQGVGVHTQSTTGTVDTGNLVFDTGNQNTAAFTSSDSGSILNKTGDVTSVNNTGGSGSFLFETGSVVGSGARGSIVFDGLSVENTGFATFKQSSVASGYWGSSFPALEFDGTTALATSAFAVGITMKGNSADGAELLITTEEQASGNKGTSPIQMWSGQISGTGTGDTGTVFMFSGPHSGPSGSTGGVQFETGNSTNGNSGNVVLKTGTAGLTRGHIRITDGSEGTAGHYFVSTNTVGGGQWQNAAGIKVTADPCGDTAAFPEATLFYNDTSNYFCYCDGTNDVQMHSPATACF